MRSAHRVRLLLLWLLILPSCAVRPGVEGHRRAPRSELSAVTPDEGLGTSFRLHLSERASFLHFVDSLSRWSPYCGPVDPSYLGVSDLSQPDRAWLLRYARARQTLGHRAETDLFLWAESGFPLAERSTGHAELKAAVDHFWANPEFRDPLSRRMKELEHLRPSLEDEVARMQTGMSTLRGVVNVFQREETERRREAPLFLTYNLAPRDSQAGANGEGLYAEVDLSSSSKAVLHTQLLHEYLHLALRPRRRFRALAATPAQRDWQRSLLSTALDERGDDEAAMLDEILVHALADVIVAGHDPWGKMRDYALLGDKQRVRMWDGVRILLPIVRGQIERPLPSQEFLSQMIGAFLGQVHHLVWSCPPGITIAAKPSAG